MSLWKRFKEELGKTYDQVNTLDGGKSYSTRSSSGPVGYDRIRDTFDPNTQWDYAKRNQKAAQGVQGYQPNMSYDQEQKQIYGVKRPYRNPGQAFFGNTARLINSLAATAVVTPETLRSTVASVTGNNDALNASLKRQKFLNEAAFDPNGGLFGAGTIYDDAKDFETSTPAETDNKVKRSVAGTALEIIPFTKGAGLAANAIYKGLSKGGQIAARSVAGALENTGQDLIEQSFVNSKWNPTQTLTSAGIGVVAPNVGDLAKGTVKVVNKGTEKAQKEVASVGGVKNFFDPTKDNEFMQYRTNYDTYAKAWDKETNPTLRKQIEVGLKQESENMNRRVAELRQNTGTSLGSGPMAGYDAINNAKAKNAENALPNEVKKGQTQQAGSILPTMEELKARQGNVSQAQEIASKYGGKLEDVQRNIDRHGYEATNNMYARKSDSAAFNPDTNQGIRNLDAVVTSELNKQNPNIKVTNKTQPTVKVMSPEEEASLFGTAPVQPTIKVAPVQKQPANAFQDTLPSKNRPKSVQDIVKSGGNPLYHDTDAKGIIGILDTGELKPSQAPFSSIAGQGKRVSTTRNFDNYSRYHDSPYRLVIDESKTGQKSIPDNREEFESIFNKPVKTNSVQALAIDTTNPSLIKDMQNGKLAEVLAKAKEKGIAVEPFEGKILPDEAANKEIQELTKKQFDDFYNQATAPVQKPTNTVKVTASEPQPTVTVMSPQEEASLFASASYDPTVKVTSPDAQSTVKVNSPKLNESPEVFYQKDINNVVKKYPNEFNEYSNDPTRRVARIIDKHFNELDPQTQQYLEFKAPGTDFESNTPYYNGFANAPEMSSGNSSVHASQIHHLNETVDNIHNSTTKMDSPDLPRAQGGNQTIVDKVNEPNFVFRQIDDDIYTMRANGATDKEIIQQLKSEGNKDGDIAEALFRTSTDKQPTVKVEEPTPEPNIKVVDGQKIDTTTGEILDTPRPPAKNLDDFVKNLPDSKAVTREEADALIVEGTDWLRRGAQAIDDALKRDGDSYENFSRAIHQANFDGVEPPAKYVDLYNKFVKPALDKYREASGRVVGENIGDVNNYYLPRMRVTDAGQVVFDNTSLLHSIDKEVFGSSISRRKDEFQLGVDDIDHTPEGLSRYATQALSERYRNARAVGKVIDDAKARGVDLDEQTARNVVELENQLAQNIFKATKNGGVFSTGLDKLNLVDSIGKIGQAKGKDRFVLDKGLSWVNRQISSSAELYDAPYGGSGKNIGEQMGFYRYTESQGRGTEINKIIQENKLDVGEYLTDYYQDIDIDNNIKTEIIAKTKQRIDAIDELADRTDKNGNPRFTKEELDSRRQHAYMSAEKNIARQQLIEFLENTEIQSKQLKKNINQDARRMIVIDAANKSLAEKTTNTIVGLKYVGLLGYSIRSALFNVLESRRVFSKYGTKDFLYGVTQAFKDPDMARKMGVHETKVSDILDTNNKDINPKVWKPMGFFQKSEQWKDNVLLHAARNHYQKQKLTNMELFDAIYKDFNKYGIKYGQSGALGYNKSKIGRLVGQFLQYPIKDWKIRINEGIKAMGGKGATEAERKAARAYIARDVPSTAATYLIMSAALGISWQEIAGVINPMQASPIDKDAPTDVKVVNSLPGGPFIQDLKDLYIATRMAFEEAEENETPALGDVYKNQLIKDAVTYIPGGQQIFNRTGEFINDQIRGYDENSKGRARYEAADDPVNIAKGLIFGSYTTDNAREYYGRTGVAGDLPFMGGEQKRPVSEQYQKQINEGANPSEIIDKSRSKQERDAKFYNTPQGKAWKELYTTTYNPDTKKEESDVISPEKWKGVQADKSNTTYTQLKEAAQQRNKDFGDAVDPLFTDKWSRYKNEIMTMRSQYTGDDKEMKDIANATKPWYKEYMKDYIAYINQIKDKEYEESDLYGVSPRVKEYWDLTTKNPAIPENTERDFPIISKYYDIKNNQGEEKAKEFFKANADALSAAFDAQTKAKFEWTNQMRALEGADAIDWDTFQNITFGFEADEASVYKQLGYKLGKYSSGGGSKGSNAQEASFGRMRAAPQPTIKVKVSKVKATPKPVKTIAIKRTGKRI